MNSPDVEPGTSYTPCVFFLFLSKNFFTYRNIPENQFTYWKTFINALLTCTLEISEVVSPVVHNSSPEGNVPIEAIKGEITLLTY